jgi:hypothetical protein
MDGSQRRRAGPTNENRRPAIAGALKKMSSLRHLVLRCLRLLVALAQYYSLSRGG